MKRKHPGFGKVTTLRGTYTIQRGDTLSSIAPRFGVSWQELCDMNGIEDCNMIYAGQVIEVPDVGQDDQGGIETLSPPSQTGYLVEPPTQAKTFMITPAMIYTAAGLVLAGALLFLKPRRSLPA